MRADLVEVMQDQVRTIYRAVTGHDIPAPRPGAEEAERAETSQEEITRRFVALEALARGEPRVAERVPPFSFTPALDTREGSDEVIIELAVPGVDRDDIAVELVEGTLLVTGLRRGCSDAEGWTFTHAEIPRGPFYRALPVPFAADEAPAVELDRGLLRIRLRRAPERAITPDAP